MSIKVEKADVTDIYCPYCGQFFRYMTPSDWIFEDKNSAQVTCYRCDKPFIVKLE